MERFFIDKLSECIGVLRDRVVPGGITQKEALNRLFGILDTPEVVLRMEEVNAGPSEINLAFPRGLVFLDLETTGLDTEADRIVEISALKINQDGSEEQKTVRINPGIPIPEAATKIHGISDDEVKDCPTFVQISKALLAFIDGCDMAGFNSNRFDFPMLNSHFTRFGLVWDWRSVNLIDVGNIFKIREERTLSRGVEFYLGRKHDESHSAEADIRATKEIFFSQFHRYRDLPKDFKELALYSNFNQPRVDMAGKFTLDPEGDIIFTFGPQAGKKAKNEPGFLNWMLGKDFPIDTKMVAEKILMS